MHTITVTVGSSSRVVRDTDVAVAREEAERVRTIMENHHPGETTIVESNDDVDPTKPVAPAEGPFRTSALEDSGVDPLPLLTPSRRIMREVGATQDRFTVNGKPVVVDLQPWETSIDWTPTTAPLFSFPPRLASDYSRPPSVRAGSAVGIMREGFESEPLGVATTIYRPVNHHETIADVAAATEGRATFEGALIDGHGYHIVHVFRLAAVVPERVAEIAAAHKVVFAEVDYPTNPSVRGMPLVSRLTIVHDHTGDGSIRASVVSYLGNDIVVGSACFTRRIHTGAGEKDVGVGDAARWAAVVDSMIDTASLQQGAIGALLRLAADVEMTEDHAETFAKHGVPVARESVSKKDREAAKLAGLPEPVGAIKEKTALDVVIASYRSRTSRGTSWGVWSRRLENGALSALEEITGLELPAQLFRRG